MERSNETPPPGWDEIRARCLELFEAISPTEAYVYPLVPRVDGDTTPGCVAVLPPADAE